MKSRKDPAVHDLLSPVASMVESRFVLARSACYGRSSSSIDMIKAYPQKIMGGEIKHYLIIEPAERYTASPHIGISAADLGSIEAGYKQIREGYRQGKRGLGWI